MTRKAQLPAGERFGRLVVLEYCPNPRDPKHPTYRCRCDCGNEKFVQRDNFARTRSCGCLRTEELRARSITHGQSNSREYRIWAGMKDRCSRPQAKAFQQYGAQGVTVCERWLESFENFFADMGPAPSPKHQIDRFPELDGPYKPENCRWATAKEQRLNQRRTKLYTFQGLTGTLKDHARARNMSYTAVHQRVQTLGWSVERALTTPIQVHSPTQG